MMLECPHCHRRVLPLASGECPACHENTTDKLHANENVTLLSIMEATKFPKTCCTCNEPTENLVNVQRSGRMAGVSEPKRESTSAGDALFLSFLGLFGKLIYAFSHVSDGSGAGVSTLKIRVPQCKQCAAKKRIEPASADLEHHRLSILVDRCFATVVAEMNRR
jgi:hypothetical protein